MTIRARNRITFAFTIFSFVVFIIELLLIFYGIVFKKISFPQVVNNSTSSNILFSYNPYIIVAAILLQSFYAFFTSMLVYRNFQKTQTTEIVFFMLFLLALLCDSIRILIPIFYISETYSNFLIGVGDVSLFARLLAPLSLFGIAFISKEEYRQDIEKNSLIIIVTSLFFAEFIPLNTSVIFGNFAISYGYIKLVRIFAVIINTLSSITVLINSFREEFNHFMPLGFGIMAIGYGLVFTATSPFALAAAFILLICGTYLYLDKLHRHYLWTD